MPTENVLLEHSGKWGGDQRQNPSGACTSDSLRGLNLHRRPRHRPGKRNRRIELQDASAVWNAAELDREALRAQANGALAKPLGILRKL